MDGNNARELNSAGNQALAAGDFARARELFERAVALDAVPPLFLNLAFAAQKLGDVAGEKAALDRALAIDPYYQLAIYQRAEWLLRHGTRSAAAGAFGNFLATLPPDDQIVPALRGAADRARQIVATEQAALAKALDGLASDGPLSPRIAESVALVTGRSRVFRSDPTGLYIPFLPEIPFFDRSQFPWFAELEAATDMIAQELSEVLSADAGLEPYVAFGSGTPVNQWAALNHSRDWSAFFLHRDGARVEENCARCPGTTALIEQLPLLDLPGRGPTAMFSILTPGTVIPPHTGVTNSRVVVHLPLVVPAGCGFRVGSIVREWKVGEAWAFDDTIEHEAWNRSDESRAILILDAWNPYLTGEERQQVERLTRAMEAHSGREEWSA